MKIQLGKKNNPDLHIKLIDKIDKKIESLCALQGFSAKSGEVIFIQENKTLFVGMDDFSIDSIRESGAKIARALQKFNIKNAAINGFNDYDKNYALMLGIFCGAYEFNNYKSKKTKAKCKEIFINDSAKFKDCLNKASVVGENINFAREIINTPPDGCTPLDLAKIASKIAKDSNLECKIGDLKFLKKENMSAILAVGRASVNEPRFIELKYKPKASKTRVVLVGKGLTYDSGGLSLKPSDYMTTMKADKSGGCAVLAIMNIIAKLKPNIEVIGIIGAAENMIGGNAYKPDDILSTREGVSVEIRNTDAEGRLVLADCLSYAQDLKPDILIDLATLTGACIVALGEYTSGILGFNEDLKNNFAKVAQNSGELMATLPFNKHLEKLIESKNADVANCSSSRYGGAITAGLFLAKFIREKYRDKWLHLDIAGPAFIEKEWDINPYGASGAGIRACVDYILGLQK